MWQSHNHEKLNDKSYYKTIDIEEKYIDEYDIETINELKQAIESCTKRKCSKELVNILAIMSYKYSKQSYVGTEDKKSKVVTELPDYIYIF